MAHRLLVVTVFMLFASFVPAQSTRPNARPRALDLGLKVGIVPNGPLDAITDVAGVEVGHTTIIRGDNVRTGVTAVLPHSGNLYRDKVPGAVFVGNAFGKLAGSTQVEELGEIETPILLTSTLSVPRAADALISYMLTLPGNEDVLSINPLVGETNDGYLNDIRSRSITSDDVFAAIRNAKGGPVEEGDVGAGTGTIAFDWKGGIGTSSRRLPQNLGGYTVGVLVQTNFGGVLTIAGAPVGVELGQFLDERFGRLAFGAGDVVCGQQQNDPVAREQGAALHHRPRRNAVDAHQRGQFHGQFARQMTGGGFGGVPSQAASSGRHGAGAGCQH